MVPGLGLPAALSGEQNLTEQTEAAAPCAVPRSCLKSKGLGFGYNILSYLVLYYRILSFTTVYFTLSYK